MCALLISLLAALTSTLRTRASLQIEILELRHQLSVLQRSQRRRVALRTIDRLLWISLARRSIRQSPPDPSHQVLTDPETISLTRAPHGQRKLGLDGLFGTDNAAQMKQIQPGWTFW